MRGVFHWKGSVLKHEFVPVDLTEITRHSNVCRTVVFIQLDWALKTRTKWLTLGQARIRKRRESTYDGAWVLDAYLVEGATDFEHSSSFALCLPIIGLTYQGTEYHKSEFTAWVDPNDPEGFRVPPPGYNPMAHPEAEECSGFYDPKKKQYCKWNDGKPHVIVPSGMYLPPSNQDLYKSVRGKQLEIVIGPSPDPE